MEDEELWKMFNPTLKKRETILFFLIVVINGLTWKWIENELLWKMFNPTILFFLIVVINWLTWIVSDIGLDTCARGRWKVEVSKMEMNQALGSSYLTTHSE